MQTLLNHQRRSISRAAIALAALVSVFIMAALMALPAAAATQAQDSNPTPATVDPGPGTAYIGPTLWGILQQQSVGSDTPTQINVTLVVRGDVTLDQTLADHIKAVGGTSATDGTWNIPTARTAEIVQRGDVVSASLVQQTQPASNPQLDDTLNLVAQAMSAGIPTADAVQYASHIRKDRVVVEVLAADKQQAALIQKWLLKEKVFIPYSQRTANNDDSVFGLLIPMEKVSPLIAKFSSANVRATNQLHTWIPLARKWRTNEELADEKILVDTYLPPPSEFYQTLPSPTPDAKYQAALNASAAKSKERHNVTPWHDHANDYEGTGVTVGIIDWGYSGFNEIPHLPTMSKTKDKGTTTSNAFCQKLFHSILANAPNLRGNENDCEPVFARGLYRMRHGNNIAEIVLRMAPKATLLMAQANSPQQVYEAANWLNVNGADVIVHAGGWQYDSSGNGEPVITSTAGDLGSDPHNPERYKPSPLHTVDEITEDGTVWINAAGNHDKWSLWLDNIKLVKGGKYDGYVKFHENKRTATGQTCQKMPNKYKQITYYSMRWADTWPDAEFDVEYEIDHAWPGLPNTFRPHQNSSGVTQHTEDYPFRRSSKIADWANDLCLRIKVESDGNDDDDELKAPKWIQFQALVGKDAQDIAPDWAQDTTGRSVVNPSETDNEGLLAVGARSLLSSSMAVTDYTSRGPVFFPEDDVTSATPDRIKPDVVASTDAATYSKWKWDCLPGRKEADACDDLYFTGTSAATAHTGGLAALVVQWLKEVGADYTAADVANFLRQSAVDIPPTGLDQNSGRGFVSMPCPSTAKGLGDFTVSSASWSRTDCISEKQQASKADYYTFYLTSTKKVGIELSSTDRITSLYLREGAHGRAPLIAISEGATTKSDDSEIEMLLEKGTYTIEAAIKQSDSGTSGTYRLEVDTTSPSAYLDTDPSVSPFTVGYASREYRLYSDNWVQVVVNPTGSAKVLDVARTKPTSSSCTATANDTVYVNNGGYIYLTGCAAGDGLIKIYDFYTRELLNIYRVKVNP